MTKIKFFQELINSLFVKPKIKKSLNFFLDKKKQLTTKEYVHNVASAKGEVSALYHAELLISHCEQMSEKELINFFELLRKNYEVDVNKLLLAMQNYEIEKTSENLVKLIELSEPLRRDIFRRCNAISRGTIRLVQLRKKLLESIIKKPDLKAVDFDLVYLFKNWFNRGFLILRPINWETPAHILEKIIAYEAVHEINSWDELRARLAPKDRRCFAFFHPAMQDEPIIFVEVALTSEIPSNIQSVLQQDRSILEPEVAKVAVFYSISNCQKGLNGISFGNFLIKQVATDLSFEFKNLKKFVTLSPIPGFRKWIKNKYPKLDVKIEKTKKPDQLSKIKDDLLNCLGEYFFKSERSDEMPNDPVARFHLGNGASLEQINFLGDISSNGINLSGGLMVNYLYDLDNVEQNHEKFVSEKKINISKHVKNSLMMYYKDLNKLN